MLLQLKFAPEVSITIQYRLSGSPSWLMAFDRPLSLFAGLRIKLVLLVIVGTALAVTAIGALRVHEERQRIYAEMQRSGEERVDTTAEAVANLLVGYDYSNMESLAERLVQQQDVRDVVIRNQAGKVMVTRSKPEAAANETLPFQAAVYFDGRQIGTVSLTLSLARMTQEIARTYREVVYEQLLFGLILGVLIYFTTSRVIVKPITRINRHMQELIESDHAATAETLEVSSRDEIGDLTRIFNNLNQKVHEAQQRLEQKIDLAGTALMESNKQLQQRSDELEKALALLERMAVTDSLTQLHNRRYFDDTLNSAFARAQRYREAVTLLLVDVDHFKQINDTYGHAAGDAVLKRLARLFKERTRETDVVARLGGDEFAFLLFHCESHGGENFAREILDGARQLRFLFEGAEIRIGLSIGLACCKEGIQTIEALYGAADEALYEAKRHGRDQVVTYACPSSQLGAKAEVYVLHSDKKGKE